MEAQMTYFTTARSKAVAKAGLVIEQAPHGHFYVIKHGEGWLETFGTRLLAEAFILGYMRGSQS